MKWIPLGFMFMMAVFLYWMGWRSMQKQCRLIEHIKTRGPLNAKFAHDCPVEGCCGWHEEKP